MSTSSSTFPFAAALFRSRTIASILVLFAWTAFTRADSPTPKPPVEQNVAEIRALVIKAAAENIARLKQCKLTWARTTMTNGSVANSPQTGTTRGSYELWKDGVRVATKADAEGWVSIPNQPPSIQKFKYRTTFDGDEFREFDPGPPKSRMWITDKVRYRHQANYLEIIGWHLPTDVQTYAETPGIEPLTWSCVLVDGSGEKVYRFRMNNAKGTIQLDYNADRGFQIQRRELQRADGTVYSCSDYSLERVASDLWFPTALKSESIDANGKVVNRSEYILDKSASTFNQPIPEESFALAITPSMSIGDGRGWFPAEYSGRTAPASIFEKMWIVTSKTAVGAFNRVRTREAKPYLWIALVVLVGFLCFRIGLFVGMRQSPPDANSMQRRERTEFDDRGSPTS